MSKQFISMFKKNIQILMNNKLSFIILFLGPIFLLFLITVMYYNQTSFNFQVGIVNQNSDDLISNTLIENFKNSGFLVVNYETKSICESSLQKSKVQGCIFFPQNLSLGSNKSIDVLIDNSKGEVKEVIENIFKSSLSGTKYDLSHNLINTILINLENLENQLSNISNNNNLTKGELNEIKYQLDEITILSSRANLAFNVDLLDLDKIQTRFNSTQNSKTTTVNSNVKTVSISKNITNQLDLEIPNLNLSSADESELLGLVSDLEDELNKIESSLISYNNSNFYSSSINLEIDKITKNLALIEEKIDTSLTSQKEFIDNSSKKIGSFETQINIEETQISNSLLESKSFELRNPDIILSPIQVNYQNSVELNNSRLVSLFPSVFGTLLLILSLFLGAILSFKEKTSPARIRNILAAPSTLKITISQILSVVSILYIQILIIAVIFYLTFIQKYYLDLAIILIMLFLFLVVFVSIGILIGEIVKTQLSLFLTLLTILFILFLTSGVILPLELLNSFFALILEMINPYLAMQNILRKILLFSVEFNYILVDSLVLFSTFIIVFSVSLTINSYNNCGYLFDLIHKIRKEKFNFLKKK